MVLGGFEIATDQPNSEGRTELILPSLDKRPRLSAVPDTRLFCAVCPYRMPTEIRVPLARANSELVRSPTCRFFFSTTRSPLASPSVGRLPFRLIE